jgi:hypothetical protein
MIKRVLTLSFFMSATIISAEVTFPLITTVSGNTYSNAVIKTADDQRVKISDDDGSRYLHYKDISPTSLEAMKPELERIKQASELEAKEKANKSTILGKTTKECELMYKSLPSTYSNSFSFCPEMRVTLNDYSVDIYFINGIAEKVTYRKNIGLREIAQIDTLVSIYIDLLRNKLAPNQEWIGNLKSPNLWSVPIELTSRDQNFFALIFRSDMRERDYLTLELRTKRYNDAEQAWSDKVDEGYKSSLQQEAKGL